MIRLKPLYNEIKIIKPNQIVNNRMLMDFLNKNKLEVLTKLGEKKELDGFISSFIDYFPSTHNFIYNWASKTETEKRKYYTNKLIQTLIDEPFEYDGDGKPGEENDISLSTIYGSISFSYKDKTSREVNEKFSPLKIKDTIIYYISY